MGRPLTAVLLALAVAVVASPLASTALAAGAPGPMSSGETAEEAQTTGPVETTTTPDDGPDGHADDPLPSWLPLLFAGGLIVGIAVVGGGLWFVGSRVRRFLGR